ncbi:acyl-CoA thioesterase [Bacillus pfraonensis]|uniref:acyl-CoA thioesterase n=1 Tax=Bacillus TaxID=1386 RepID=UPI002A4FB38D|nr:acyl-CoA thioesterase [Bacillus pseudomycoides]HEK9104167.1 acyl-CoA thioesterase [Bacillus pseudomycoides]
MFKQDIIVRFSECDSLGHVNNANYFTYFEEARNELFKIFNPSLEIESWNLIVASTQCDFIREAAYAQKITVYTWISEIGNASFQVEHVIQDKNQNWIARGKVILVHFNFQSQKSIPLPKEIRRVLSKHNEAPKGVPMLR